LGLPTTAKGNERERGEDKGAERRRERQPSARNGTRHTNIGIAHQGVSTG